MQKPADGYSCDENYVTILQQKPEDRENKSTLEWNYRRVGGRGGRAEHERETRLLQHRPVWNRQRGASQAVSSATTGTWRSWFLCAPTLTGRSTRQKRRASSATCRCNGAGGSASTETHSTPISSTARSTPLDLLSQKLTVYPLATQRNSPLSTQLRRI